MFPISFNFKQVGMHIVISSRCLPSSISITFWRPILNQFQIFSANVNVWVQLSFMISQLHRVSLHKGWKEGRKKHSAFVTTQYWTHHPTQSVSTATSKYRESYSSCSHFQKIGPSLCELCCRVVVQGFSSQWCPYIYN